MSTAHMGMTPEENLLQAMDKAEAYWERRALADEALLVRIRDLAYEGGQDAGFIRRLIQAVFEEDPQRWRP